MRAIMAQSTMPSWLAGRRATTDWGKGSSMSENTRLTAVLGEICVLLEKHGHPDFALRLKGQAKILAQKEISPDELEAVRKRLHGAVLGMGGLADLWLEAPTHAESVSAQKTLASLSDELYELTR